MNSRIEPQSTIFDPQQHPEGTLKAFDDFVQQFELRYRTQYPDPPKVSLDAVLAHWKIGDS